MMEHVLIAKLPLDLNRLGRIDSFDGRSQGRHHQEDRWSKISYRARMPDRCGARRTVAPDWIPPPSFNPSNIP